MCACLAVEDVGGAVGVLQRGVGRVACLPPAALHAASKLLVATTPDELAAAADVADAAAGCPRPEGGGGGSHDGDALLPRLTALLPAAALVPPGRLEALLEGALGAQARGCEAHNAELLPAGASSSHRGSAPLSLLRDHSCPSAADSLPSSPWAVLKEHGGEEVWHCAWSPCGRWLASGGKAHAVVLHSFSAASGAVACSALLRGHVAAVTQVSFSPDGRTLLTSSLDATARLWDIPTGDPIAVLAGHADSVTAACFISLSSCFTVVRAHRRTRGSIRSFF